ncbi:MAG: cytochrome c oxidase assembly protein, partial [Streptosporangiaceae bacterium]
AADGGAGQPGAAGGQAGAAGGQAGASRMTAAGHSAGERATAGRGPDGRGPDGRGPGGAGLGGQVPGARAMEPTAALPRWLVPLRAAAQFGLRPWVSVTAFNLAMIFWHLPGSLDVSVTNAAVRTWLMHGSFLVVGVLFWLQFIGSPPVRMRMPPLAQVSALLITNVVMWVLAMAMGILSSASWYPVYDHVPGVTLPPFADQQIGAGILWICGDFWAIPCMVLVFRRLVVADGSISAAVDRMLGRGSSRYQWANRA